MVPKLLLLITVAICLPVEAADVSHPKLMTYRQVEGRQLKAHVFAPEAQASGAAVLLFHGGGWSMGEPAWTYAAARRFADLGLTAMAVEYRLTDENVTPADALADTCAAFAWVRQQAEALGIDAHRVAGYGVSAGGHLVAAAATVGCTEAGAAGRPNVLLLWSPAIDVSTDRWFDRQLQGTAVAVDYSPAQHVGPETPPTSIVNGDRDTLTPLSGSETYCEQLRGFGVRCDLHVYKGVGHLLTRNLANQERDFDPDPAAVADGIAQLAAFLAELGYTTAADTDPADSHPS